MSSKNTALLEMFLAEANELLVDMEEGLITLEEHVAAGSEEDVDRELLNQIFRGAHTIKGNAGLLELPEIVHVVHVMENVFDQMRGGNLPLSADLVSTLLASLDTVRELLDRLAADESLSEGLDLDAAARRIERLLDVGGGEEEAVAEEPTPEEPTPEEPLAATDLRQYFITLRFGPELFAEGQEPMILFGELEALGELLRVEVDDTALPALGELDPEQLYLSWNVVLETAGEEEEIHDVFLFLMEDHDIRIRDITDLLQQAGPEALLGDVLVRCGLVSQDRVDAALDSQRRVGALLVEEGALGDDDLERALSIQRAVRALRPAGSLSIRTELAEQLAGYVGRLVRELERTGLTGFGNRRPADDSTLRVVLRDLESTARSLQGLALAIRSPEKSVDAYATLQTLQWDLRKGGRS